LNYVDLIITILLVLAFLRGFSSGLYRTFTNLVSSIAAFLAAVFFSGPLVSYFEAKYGIMTSMASWWGNAIHLFPGVSEPFDPGSFDRIFTSMDGSNWAQPLRSGLKESISEIQGLAGSSPSWGEILSLALARLFLTGVVFLVLLAVARLVFMVLTGTLSFADPISVTSRLAGGILESVITSFWLSTILGVLSPLLYSSMFGGIRDAVSQSMLMPFFLSIHSWIWPLVLGKLGIS
jgi:hypothetical protein